MIKDNEPPVPGRDRYNGNPEMQRFFRNRFHRAEESLFPSIRNLFSDGGLEVHPFVKEALSAIAETYGHLSAEKLRIDQAEQSQAQENRTQAAIASLQRFTTAEERQAVRNMSLSIISSTGRIIEENGLNPYAERGNLAERVFTDPTIERAAKTGLILGRQTTRMGHFSFDFSNLTDIETISSDEPPQHDAAYYERLTDFTYGFADELGFDNFSDTAKSKDKDNDWAAGTSAGLDAAISDFASGLVQGVVLTRTYSYHPSKPFLALISPKIEGTGGFNIYVTYPQLDIYLKTPPQKSQS